MNHGMMYNLGRFDRQRRAIKHEKPAQSLKEKRCSCGKLCIAKHLAQHGKCAACALVTAPTEILPGDFAKLQHIPGAVQLYQKNKWGWRNYFAAGSGQHHEAMQRFVAAGLITAGRAANEMTYFHAIRLGSKVAGIKRAMED